MDKYSEIKMLVPYGDYKRPAIKKVRTRMRTRRRPALYEYFVQIADGGWKKYTQPKEVWEAEWDIDAANRAHWPINWSLVDLQQASTKKTYPYPRCRICPGITHLFPGKAAFQRTDCSCCPIGDKEIVMWALRGVDCNKNAVQGQPAEQRFLDRRDLYLSRVKKGVRSRLREEMTS
jgi:hypothetical protein